MDSIVDLEILFSDWLTQKKIAIFIADGPWAIPMFFLTSSPASRTASLVTHFCLQHLRFHMAVI